MSANENVMLLPDDDILREFGRITIAFEWLHHRLALMVANMTAPPERQQQIMSSLQAAMSFKQLREFCNSIYFALAKNDSGKRPFGDIMKRLANVEAERNTLLHSVWFPDGTQWMQVKVKRDRTKGIKHSDRRLSVEQFRAVADEIEKLCHDISAFVFDDNQRGTDVFQVHDLGVIGGDKGSDR